MDRMGCIYCPQHDQVEILRHNSKFSLLLGLLMEPLPWKSKFCLKKEKKNIPYKLYDIFLQC